MIVTQREREREREREAETQAEGEAGSMHQEPDMGFDPRSPGLRPGPKAGAKPLRHPGIPVFLYVNQNINQHLSEPHFFIGCNHAFYGHKSSANISEIIL